MPHSALSWTPFRVDWRSAAVTAQDHILAEVDDPWRRKWQPTPVFSPGESHGQRSLAGYSWWGHKELEMIERLKHTGVDDESLWKVARCSWKNHEVCSLLRLADFNQYYAFVWSIQVAACINTLLLFCHCIVLACLQTMGLQSQTWLTNSATRTAVPCCMDVHELRDILIVSVDFRVVSQIKRL